VQDKAGAAAAAEYEATSAAMVTTAKGEEKAFVTGQAAGRIGVEHPNDLLRNRRWRGGIRRWMGKTEIKARKAAG
jgi:hypothetical protein